MLKKGKLKINTPPITLTPPLSKLIESLNEFDDSSYILDELREEYYNPTFMSESEWAEFEKDKAIVIAFNHLLRDAITSPLHTFTFDELLEFIVSKYIERKGHENRDRFYERIYTTLVGARNEVAFRHVLEAGGIDYELGTGAEDAMGGDFIVNGVPIDVKSSPKGVERSRRRAIEAHHNPNTIVWSHIEHDDYEGSLTLSPNVAAAIFRRLKPDLDKALWSYGLHKNHHEEKSLI